MPFTYSQWSNIKKFDYQDIPAQPDHPDVLINLRTGKFSIPLLKKSIILPEERKNALKRYLQKEKIRKERIIQ